MPLGTPLQVFGGQPIDEAAFLSSSAYGLPNQPNADDLNNRLLAQGWTLITNLPGIGIDGYYSSNTATQAGPATQPPENSVAFAAVKGDTVAISFRGTYIVTPNKDILQI